MAATYFPQKGTPAVETLGDSDHREHSLASRHKTQAPKGAQEPGMSRIDMVTVNLGGVQSPGRYAAFCSTARDWCKLNRAQVFLVQEHNLDPDKQEEHKRMAHSCGFDAIISYAPPAGDNVHRGGTFIMVAHAAATVDSVLHQEPGITRISITTATDLTLDIASIYAPVKPIERTNFFSHLRQKLSDHTIAGGDWNCVPDITLDVKSANPLAYLNVGASLLSKVMEKLHLHDYRREQLGKEFEATRIGNTTNGTTATRLDRWLVPLHADFDGHRWNIMTQPKWIWSKENKDHMPVLLRVECGEGQRGQDRENVREDLVFLPNVQVRIIECLDKAYEGQSPHWKKWERAMSDIAELLIKETKALTKKESKKKKRLSAELTITIKHANRTGYTEDTLSRINGLKAEIYEIEHPEAPQIASKAQAKMMTDRSEECTRQYFQTYKSIQKKSWISKVFKAEWKEGEDPQIDPSNKYEENPDNVANELSKYYKMLFSVKQTQAEARQHIINRLRNKAISKRSAQTMDRIIEDEEVEKIMAQLTLGKQPGPNRVPNAVFRCLSSVFAPKLAQVLRDAVGGAPLPPSMMEGDICVLHKKKARTDVRNYRPITLLNSDYKVYTKVLANRLKEVVHQFVSEAQKGFVPDVFIAECSMTLNLIEAWINEEPEDREGLFLFLDMEKAFDRVSYKYLNDAMEALAFGPNFRRAVGLMYDEASPPKRRILANGYYSDWFEIKSGVAQGCPLSPLLFLLVAEGLKISMDMQSKFKGIKIGDRHHKISQFADDTTLMLRNHRELQHAEKGLARWCKATGMRENKAKREGLAMGRLRHSVLPRGTEGPLPKTVQRNIEWVPDGQWAVSLGVPIGNNLDHEKWWSKKLEAVRAVSRQWQGLYRSGYFGRNLIVQSMYLGRLRYWLYSIPMSKNMRNMVQDDADTLWWSREPKLGGERKRFRRFVAKKTAIGPKEKGGLGNLDWTSHVDSFLSQWMTRYVDPSHSSWKSILDALIFKDKSNKDRFAVSDRGLLFSKTSRKDRYKILKGLPKRAKYIRECMLAHWRLDIQQETEDKGNLAAEPIWRNARFSLEVSTKEELWLSSKLKLHKLIDIIDQNTRHPKTYRQWRKHVEACQLEDTWSSHQASYVLREVYGRDSLMIRMDTARRLVSIFSKVPEDVIYMLRQTPLQAAFEPASYRIHVQEDGETERHVRCEGSTQSLRVALRDNVGKLSLTDTLIPAAGETLRDVAEWSPKEDDCRYLGQYIKTFPLPRGWTVDDTPVRLDRLSIKQRTQLLALRKMKPPAAVLKWEQKYLRSELQALGMELPWNKIWTLTSFYATKRDQFTWLRLKHRNLYTVGHREDLDDNSCRACTQRENQMHLITCPIIKTEFWNEIFKLIQTLGFDTPEPAHVVLLLTLGCVIDRQHGCLKVTTQEMAGLLYIAWRCLYAEIVGSRVDQRPIKLEYAYKRTVQICITRLTAYGEKWLRWVNINKHTSNKSFIPLSKQNRTVIKQDGEGEYTIHSVFLSEMTRLADVTAPARAAPPNQPRPRCVCAQAQPRPIVWPVPTRQVGPTSQTALTNYFST